VIKTESANSRYGEKFFRRLLEARFANLGATAFPVSPAAFGKFMAEETKKWGNVIKFSGANVE
jgi:hypothetical protein